MGYDGYFNGVCFFLALQWVAAAGRVYTRTCIVKKFGWDDAAMLLTLAVSTAFMGIMLAIVVMTNNAPIWDLDYDTLILSTNLTLTADVTYIAATTILKVAIALLLVRVLISRWQVITIYVVLAISVAYGIFYFFYVLFQCGNPKNFAIETISYGICLSSTAIDTTSYIHAVLSALADCTFAVLPVSFLWKSNLAKRAKISVGFILVLGTFGCICTIIRIPWIHYLTRTTLTYFITVRGIALMSAAELSVGITCISLATYKPLVHKYFPQLSEYYYGGTYGSAYGDHSRHSRLEQAGSVPMSVTSNQDDVPKYDGGFNQTRALSPIEKHSESMSGSFDRKFGV